MDSHRGHCQALSKSQFCGGDRDRDLDGLLLLAGTPEPAEDRGTPEPAEDLAGTSEFELARTPELCFGLAFAVTAGGGRADGFGLAFATTGGDGGGGVEGGDGGGGGGRRSCSNRSSQKPSCWS